MKNQPKIHAKLKWETLLNRINEIRKDTKFMIDSSGTIYRFSYAVDAWIYVCKSTYDKENFIEEEAYCTERQARTELNANEKTKILNALVQNEFKETYYPMAYGEDRANWPS